MSLRRPIPLDRDLDLTPDDRGGVRVTHEGELIAEGSPGSPLDQNVPQPVELDEAEAARERYLGNVQTEFGHCFVCGTERDDSYRVFAGQVEGRELVATPWTPDPAVAGPDGKVPDEYVWAVLDCPTYFAMCLNGWRGVGFLAQMSAEVSGDVRPAAPYIVSAWPIARDGRKMRAGAALHTADGDLVARARTLMIEPAA